VSDEELVPGIAPTLHEAALDELPWPILVHDHDCVLYVNRAALSALGARDSTQIEGRPIAEIVHPDGAEAGTARRRIVLEQGHAVTDVPVKLLGVDGVTRYAIATGRPVRYGNAEKAVLVTAVITRIGDSAE